MSITDQSRQQQLSIACFGFAHVRVAAAVAVLLLLHPGVHDGGSFEHTAGC